eukprot:1408453-Pyramimonas_sp.AAC.1
MKVHNGGRAYGYLKKGARIMETVAPQVQHQDWPSSARWVLKARQPCTYTSRSLLIGQRLRL